MRVDIYDYDLPVEKIATSPVRPRDASRLLDLTGGKIADKSIRDLPGIFQPNAPVSYTHLTLPTKA